MAQHAPSCRLTLTAVPPAMRMHIEPIHTGVAPTPPHPSSSTSAKRGSFDASSGSTKRSTAQPRSETCTRQGSRAAASGSVRGSSMPSSARLARPRVGCACGAASAASAATNDSACRRM
eukprot:365995-Chlamydomonas_euryale.AAC.3